MFLAQIIYWQIRYYLIRKNKNKMKTIIPNNEQNDNWIKQFDNIDWEDYSYMLTLKKTLGVTTFDEVIEKHKDKFKEKLRQFII